MEFKGTKGNWRIDEETFNNDYKDNSNVVSIREETKGGYYIAEVYKNVGFDKESEANALLISKAPEMLEMLQRFVKDEELFEISSLSASLYADEFRKLIKEATEL